MIEHDASLTYTVLIKHDPVVHQPEEWVATVDGPQVSVLLRGETRLSTIADSLRAAADAIERFGGGSYGGGGGKRRTGHYEKTQEPPPPEERL
jgi:hypothetical protein